MGAPSKRATQQKQVVHIWPSSLSGCTSHWAPLPSSTFPSIQPKRIRSIQRTKCNYVQSQLQCCVLAVLCLRLASNPHGDMIYISNYFMHVYRPVRGSLLCYPRLAFAQLTLAIHSMDSQHMAMYNTKIFTTCTWQTYLLHNTHNRNRKWTSIIGASLSEPHTRVTTLQDACVCLLTYVRPYTENLNWTETKVHMHFKFANLHTC